MVIRIDGQRAVDLLRMAVETKGEDYQYEQPDGTGCFYTLPGNTAPSCIVGHALAYAGVPLDVLHAIDFGGVIREDPDFPGEEYEESGSLGDTTANNEDVIAWLERNGAVLDREAIDVFHKAQQWQDDGIAWGEAVAAAQRQLFA